ncbi:MAG: BofC C-terminal domain-containing protein [Bacillota bacterium]
MAQQERKKIKLRWLLWTGFIILLLVIGLGPLTMLISYTRTDDTGMGSFWERFRNKSSEQETEQATDEPPLLEPYMVQYLYRYCEHGQVYQPGNIPLALPEPPRALVEIAAALHNSNLSIENLMDELKNPVGWHLVDMKAQSGRSYFILTYLADFCPDCEALAYLGIFNGKIAVYQGQPPHGKLIEVTEYEVRDIHRDELTEGVPFDSEEQKNAYLEGFTS